MYILIQYEDEFYEGIIRALEFMLKYYFIQKEGKKSKAVVNGEKYCGLSYIYLRFRDTHLQS